MLGLTGIDIAILGGYFSVIAAIGVASARFIRCREDFLMGGRKLGKLRTLLLTLGIGTHADNAVGVAAQSYRLGFAGIWYQWANLFTMPLYWMVTPILRRSRVQTTAEFFERRFGRETMLVYCVFALFVSVTSTAVMLFGSARLVEALTGRVIPWQSVILVIGLISFLYGVIGGLVAAAWNEAIQGFLTIVMSFLILPFFWSHIGGLAGLQSSLVNPAATFRLVLPSDITIFWIVMMAFNQLINIVVQPPAMANVGAAKTEIDSRAGFVGGILTKRLLAVPWALTGIMALSLFGAGAIEPDHAFGQVCRELLPAGFVGLMLACVVASVMDNCAIMMISFAGIYTNAVHKYLFPQLDERQLVRAGRIAAIAFAALTLLLSYSFSDVPAAMRFLWGTVPLMGITFLLGVLWKRANRWGALASFAGAVIASLLGQFLLGWRDDDGLPKLILLFVSVGTFTGIIVSLLTKPEPKWLTESFFLLMKTPIGQEEVLRRAGFREVAGRGSFEMPATEVSLASLEEAAAAIAPEALRQAHKEAVWGVIGVTLVILAMFGGVVLMARWLAGG
jgi:SSS family solute:Na+ symporter